MHSIKKRKENRVMAMFKRPKSTRFQTEDSYISELATATASNRRDFLETLWWQRIPLHMGDAVVHVKRGNGIIVGLSAAGHVDVKYMDVKVTEKAVHRYHEHSWAKIKLAKRGSVEPMLGARSPGAFVCVKCSSLDRAVRTVLTPRSPASPPHHAYRRCRRHGKKEPALPHSGLQGGARRERCGGEALAEPRRGAARALSLAPLQGR
jgi:hypothetical protein